MMTVDTEKTTEVKENKPNWRKIGIFITTIGLAVFVFGFVYGYYALTKVNMNVIAVMEKAAEEIKENQSNIQQLRDAVADLKNQNDTTNNTLTQQQQSLTTLQQSQQGDMNKWNIAEVQYLLKQANDALQFNHDTALALIYAQRANTLLQNLNMPALLEVRKSLANDITQLQSVQQVNTTELYLKILGLKRQITNLPFPEKALQNASDQAAGEKSQQQNLSWWRKSLHATGQSLQKIVIVKKMDDKQALIFPDQKPVIMQNLAAQMEAVLWAVLNHNQAIYLANLKRVQDWVQTYFAVNDPTTESFLASIQSLQQVDLTPPDLNLADTMKLLDAYSVNQTKQ